MSQRARISNTPPNAIRRSSRLKICATTLAIFAVFLLTSNVASSADSQPAKPFVHPGLLHTKAHLDRMKAMVAKGAEPWKGGFEKLKAQTQSNADWRVRGPFPSISRDASTRLPFVQFDQDGNAAYQNALMRCITLDERYAKKSVEILNAWSGTLTNIVGKDSQLCASLGGFKYANAAKLMRHSYGRARGRTGAWRTANITGATASRMKTGAASKTGLCSSVSLFNLAAEIRSPPFSLAAWPANIVSTSGTGRSPVEDTPN